MTQKFRILSLNGGGIRGVFSASLLAELERSQGRRLIDHFDLICGTSTGGLIALGLGLGKTAAEIRDFYLGHGPAIFPNSWVERRKRSILQIAVPKHNQDVLGGLLRDFFRIGQQPGAKQPTLGSSKVPLLIPATRADDSCPTVFKTRHHSRFFRDHAMPAWRVGLATSAAPVIYPAWNDPDRGELIDGGLWANCPMLLGVVEAMDAFGRDRTDIEVLSIGTTRAPATVDRRARTGGAFHNLSMTRRTALELALNTSEEASRYLATLLIGKANILHIDDTVAPGTFSLDDSRKHKLTELRNRGAVLAQQHGSEVAKRFLGSAVNPFVQLNDTVLDVPE